MSNQNTTASTPRTGTLTADQQALAAIAAADGRHRERLVEEFLRPRVRPRGSFTSMAAELCRVNGIREVSQIEAHRDDVLGILYIEAVKILNGIAEDPTRVMKITSFDGFLFYQSKAPTRSHFDGGAAGIRPAGATARMRRRRELFKTRALLLQQWGREPSKSEILAETNKRMTSLRSDAARQSMVATMDDFESVDNVALLPEEHDRITGGPEESPLAKHEALTLLDKVAHAAGQVQPGLDAVARAWLGGVYDGHGAPRELGEVAKVCGLSIGQAAKAISRVQEIATSQLAAEFGISAGGAR